MKKKITVSVILITYGHEKYIREAVEGVLMQECDFEVELIVANDCSPDNTDEIMNDIIDKHTRASRISYLKQKKNIGVMPNFMSTLLKAKGEFIALCEGDDFWTDRFKLQKQVNFLKGNTEFVVCYHDCNVVDWNSLQKSSSLLKGKNHDYSCDDLKKGAWMPTLTRCFRNVVKLYPKDIYKVYAGDLFLTSVLGNYGKGKYLPFNGGSYREHSQGLWSKLNEFERLKMNLKDFKLLKNTYEREYKQEDIAYFYKQKMYRVFKKLEKTNSVTFFCFEFIFLFKWDYLNYTVNKLKNKIKSKIEKSSK